MTKFEIFRDSAGYYRWRLKAANGEIVASSEGYVSEYSATQSAQKVKLWASHASVIRV